jgi:hypothetical protein
MPNTLVLRRYDDVRKEIKDCWLLAYRGRHFWSRLIAKAGRTLVSHVEKVVLWGDEPFAIGSTASRGVTAVSLASCVRASSGLIDVYECNPDNRWPEYDVAGAAAYLKSRTGNHYGWGSILWIVLSRLPGLRWIFRVSTEDSEDWHVPPMCSQLATAADRVGGKVDPVPNLADQFTEPSDLVRSSFYRYVYTLTE